MDAIHEYTVCFLFSHDLQQVLLVRKNATDFAGRLNGVGGELEKGEQAYTCAGHEIREETGISDDGLRSLGLVRLAPLGTLSLPHDCKYGSGKAVLHYFAGALKNGAVPAEKTDKGEDLVWSRVSEVLASGVDSDEYAGNGDLPYFVNAGLSALKRYLPEWRDDQNGGRADGEE